MAITDGKTPNYEQEPDYTRFLDTLFKKTKEGKLNWQETAREDTFIAAVKGQQTFEICKVTDWVPDQGEGDAVVVTVKDSKGKVLFRTPEEYLASAWALYELAQRVGQRVDERLQTTVQLLNTL